MTDLGITVAWVVPLVVILIAVWSRSNWMGPVSIMFPSAVFVAAGVVIGLAGWPA